MRESAENNGDTNWTCWLRTVFAGIGAMILLMFMGAEEAQTSVMLPQLKKVDSLIHVTPDEETWIASLGVVMSPVSAIISGPFIDTFGRKKGLQMFYFITGISYAVMGWSRNVYHIYLGRIICSIGSGLFASGIVYLVEICTNQQREYLFSITSALFSSGVTLMCIIGGYLPWHVASLIFSITSFVLLVVVSFVPESPAWLFKMGERDAAIRSFQTLGRSEAGIQQELDTLKLQCKDKDKEFQLRVFIEPTVWKPFIIMTIFFLLPCASGLLDLLFYSVDFIERLGTTYNPVNVAVTLATTRLFACSTVVIIFRSRIGRKVAVAFSGFWMTVAFVALGAYEYIYRDVPSSERPFHWFPVSALLLYMIGSVLGMLGLPWVMSGEVYPLKVRGIMTAVTHVVANGIGFVFVKIYHVAIDGLHMYGLIFTCAGFSFSAIFFAIFVLPETQNKSLFEIEEGFLPKKKRQIYETQITRI